MVSRSCLCVLGLVVCLIGGAMSERRNITTSRQKRLFSLFNIVTFENEACTTTGAGNLIGTCLTSTECADMRGSPSGNCAAGFGVCCLFDVAGDCSTEQTISQNCTYIRNNGFPSADMTPSETCTYNFNRIDNSACGTANDAITVTSPFSPSANAFPPTVCGTLSGQHMYFETGTTGTAGALTIAKGTTAGNRIFQIKVTYYNCNNLAKAPASCTQYFTGESGSFQSYNFEGNQLLQNMNYNNCFRQEEGFCRLQISEATAMTPDPFLLSDDGDGDVAVKATVLDCATVSYVAFTTPTNTMFCGENLSSKAGDTIPGALTSAPGDSFLVGLRTVGTTLAGYTGFNLNYKQVACP
ncbi:uncharacterized protein LOC131885021 isoform X3 [Tigriopus californicus]|uniref:uncharacterized protein LOC131885021 isoform X3 n=1 Tax=Tigriopus californicus TaxID=6832 RepID=UPI0027DA0E5D|nr:uncharacterized protein LOC131885021 isoform X3 [Tigriopus californicus]